MPRRLIRLRSWAQGRAVVAEAAELLDGRAVDRSNWPSRVPSYLPLSWLVHSSRARLAMLADQAAHPATWDGTVAYLAAELLALASDDTALRLVQRRALLPLELEVLARGDDRMPNPRGLARAVTAALDAYRYGPLPW